MQPRARACESGSLQRRRAVHARLRHPVPTSSGPRVRCEHNLQLPHVLRAGSRAHASPSAANTHTACEVGDCTARRCRGLRNDGKRRTCEGILARNTRMFTQEDHRRPSEGATLLPDVTSSMGPSCVCPKSVSARVSQPRSLAADAADVSGWEAWSIDRVGHGALAPTTSIHYPSCPSRGWSPPRQCRMCTRTP